MRLVVDSSVVIKWFVPEVLTEAAIRLRDRLQEESGQIAVPRLFFTESANVLWKKTCLAKEVSAGDSKGILSRILDLPFHVVEDEELLLSALNIALDNSVSVYDGLYLACALKMKAVFVTADSKLVRRFSRVAIRDSVRFVADY